MPNMKMNPKETALYIQNIKKSFGSTRALKGVDLVVEPGEIHGLLGQNGCGKSTLIKILAGYHEPDSGGELWINGEHVKLPVNPGEFAKYGISFVHQDLGLIPELSVLDNWTLNMVALTNDVCINWNKERKYAREIFERYGLKIDPDVIVATLGPVQKAMLAIIRAVENLKINDVVKTKKRGILVLDEPTVFLPRAEVNTLFNLVKSFASEGISIIFVSHDIDEVLELTDKFTVLRDGLNVGEGTTMLATKEQIIEIILGKRLIRYQMDSSNADFTFKGKDFVVAKNIKGLIVNDIDFNISPGEIVGITGLVGSGFEEIPYLLYGANDYQRGTVKLGDILINLKYFSPKQAIKHQMALIPADRVGFGGVGSLSIEHNLNMQVMKKFSPIRLQKKKLNENANELIQQYEVHPKDASLGFSQLSGGNQQKVLFAKWVQEVPSLLLLHEPTQGVDVGTRQQIYRHINKVAQEGAAVLCSSSDYEELTQICNRVIVLVRGQIINELTGHQITKEQITTLCFQSLDAAV